MINVLTREPYFLRTESIHWFVIRDSTIQKITQYPGHRTFGRGSRYKGNGRCERP